MDRSGSGRAIGPAGGRQKLLSIQYIRAVATLTVVAAHATNTLFDFGEAAVSLFFVISGFVMVYVSRRETTPQAFLWARFVRVVPLYWVVTLFVGFAYGSDTDHLVLSLLFWPHPGPAGHGWPVVGQGWTLVFEVFFYVVFAATLLASARVRPWLLAVIFAACWLGGLIFQPEDFVLVTYTSPLLLEFAAGALLHEAWRRDLLPRGGIAMLTILVAALLLAAQAWWGSPEHRWAAWGVVSVVLLAGALGLERGGAMPNLPFLTLLGDASYSLYLMQFFVLNPLRGRLAGWPELAAVPVKLLACAALGLATYFLLERPLQRFAKWAASPAITARLGRTAA